MRVDLLLGRTGGLRLKVHGNIRRSVDVSCRVGFSDSVPFARLYYLSDSTMACILLCTHTHIYTCIYIYIHTSCTYIGSRVEVYRCVLHILGIRVIRIYHMYIYIYIYTRTHIHIHTDRHGTTCMSDYAANYAHFCVSDMSPCTRTHTHKLIHRENKCKDKKSELQFIGKLRASASMYNPKLSIVDPRWHCVLQIVQKPGNAVHPKHTNQQSVQFRRAETT